MGFLHVGQAGLELLTSGDLPASASQSAEMTGVSHCTRPGSPCFTDEETGAPGKVRNLFKGTVTELGLTPAVSNSMCAPSAALLFASWSAV